MAQHKSAKQRIRITKRKNERNSQYLSSVRTAVKKFRSAAESGEGKDSIKELYTKAQSMLSKAANKGILHSNTVSRRVGRLAKLLRLIEEGKPAPMPKKSTKKKTGKSSASKK